MHKSFTHAKCHAKSNREADNGRTYWSITLLIFQATPTLLSCILFSFFVYWNLPTVYRQSLFYFIYINIYIITYMYVLSVYIWQYCYASFHSLEHSNDVMYVCMEPMETKSDKRLDCLLFFNRILRHMHLRLVHTCHTSLSLKNFHNKKKLRHLITKCVEK